MNNLKSPKIYFIVAVVVFILLIIGIIRKEIKHKSTTESTTEEATFALEETSTPIPKTNTFEEPNTTNDDVNTVYEEDKATFHYKTKLTNGYYYSGINIPRGVYNVKWISGSGSITFDDEPGFGISLGKGENNIQKYKNLNLSDYCSYLEVTDTLKIEIDCKNAMYDENYTNEATKKVILESGKYETGIDISPGIYDVTCLKGSGNFQTDDEINVLLSTKTHYGILGSYYVKKVKFIKLKEGEKIDLKGFKAQFVPSKIAFKKNLAKQ